MAWPEDSWLACGEWLRDGDDRPAECEVPGAVLENPARGEGGKAGVVERSMNGNNMEVQRRYGY